MSVHTFFEKPHLRTLSHVSLCIFEYSLPFRAYVLFKRPPMYITYTFTVTFHVFLSFVICGFEERTFHNSVLQEIMEILKFEVKRYRKNVNSTIYKDTDINQIC